MTLKKPTRTGVLLGLILVVASTLRLVNIHFGLPGLYDPDEPMFVLKAFKLLDDRTLNPGWFGHPGSTTIYLLALVDVVVAGLAFATGSATSLPQFAASIYADPAIIFVPSRIAMVVISLMTIVMTYLVGRRLLGTTAALIGAALLALNALHIEWSQVIRTDIHASLFMMIALFFAIRAAQDGRGRDLIIGGLFVGFAMATKWPGGCAFAAVLGAALMLISRFGLVRTAPVIVGATLAVPLGLFIASPYILLDWRTARSNVSGEVASGHLGHSGDGFASNLAAYLTEQLAGTMGWLGLALVVAGLALMLTRPVARVTLVPMTILFIVLISAQQQIWSRWLTPALPTLCLAAGYTAASLIEFARARIGSGKRAPDWLRAAVAAAVLLPSAAGAYAGMRERGNDTRRLASAWARMHFPAGSTVIVEHLALDLDDTPWTILFPIGSAGCVDGRGLLSSGVKIDDVQKRRGGSPIVDLGNVPTPQLSTCHANFAILTYYDLYLAERDSYAAEVSTYRQLIGTGTTLALFRPQKGVSAGPITRIVSLKPVGPIQRPSGG